MGKPFKIKHGLICAGELLEVDNEKDEVRIKGVIAATLDDLVGGGGTIGDINDLTTDDKSSIVASINEVDLNTTNNAADISTLETGLADEINARISEDSTINTKLDVEISNRLSSENTIRDSITAEENARAAADGVIQDNITQEISDRTDADNVLQSNITQEISDRTDADTAIRDDLGQDILDEATTRSQIDTNLQIQINAIQSDINKFHLVDIASNYTHDFSNGNYLKVINSGNDFSHSIILPEIIANGGAKLSIDNTTDGYIKVKDHLGNLIQSVFPQSISELVFDGSNTLDHSEALISTTNNPIINSSVNQNLIIPSGSEDDVTIKADDTRLLHLSNDGVWRFAVNDISTLTELGSAIVSTDPPGYSKCYCDFLGNDYFIVNSNSTYLNIWHLEGGGLVSKGNSFSIPGSVAVSSLIVLKEDRFVVVTTSSAERILYLIGIDDYTNFNMSVLDTITISVSTTDSFTQLFKFSESKVGLVYSTTNFETKSYQSVDITNDSFTLSAPYSLNQNKCRQFVSLDESTFAYGTNLKFYTVKLDGLNVVSHLNVDIDPVFGFSNNVELGLSFSKSIQTVDQKNVGIIAQLGGTEYKFIHFYYSTVDDSIPINFKGSESFIYNTNVHLIPNSVAVGNNNFIIATKEDNYNSAPMFFNEFKNVENYSSKFEQELITVQSLDVLEYVNTGFLQSENSIIKHDCHAGYFIGDGSQLTGIPGGYDQSLNTTDNVTFNNISGNDITANVFHGDGSQLTGITAYDQSLNIGDDVVFGEVTATSYVGLPPGLKVYKTICGEGTADPTEIDDRVYTLPENGVGWQIGTCATLNANNDYGTELGTSADDLMLVHPKGVPPFMVILHRNKNKGFAAGMGITDFDIGWKANLANTAIRIDVFPTEEYEFWLQVVFL
jgi:hypothetical protein